MTNTTLYGQLASEKTANENQMCREMVKEISQLGITERQRTLLIYLLALELENQEHVRAITSAVKDAAGKDIFLSGNVEDEET